MDNMCVWDPPTGAFSDPGRRSTTGTTSSCTSRGRGSAAAATACRYRAQEAVQHPAGTLRGTFRRRTRLRDDVQSADEYPDADLVIAPGRHQLAHPQPVRGTSSSRDVVTRGRTATSGFGTNKPHDAHLPREDRARLVQATSYKSSTRRPRPSSSRRPRRRGRCYGLGPGRPGAVDRLLREARSQPAGRAKDQRATCAAGVAELQRVKRVGGRTSTAATMSCFRWATRGAHRALLRSVWHRSSRSRTRSSLTRQFRDAAEESDARAHPGRARAHQSLRNVDACAPAERGRGTRWNGSRSLPPLCRTRCRRPSSSCTDADALAAHLASEPARRGVALAGFDAGSTRLAATRNRRAGGATPPMSTLQGARRGAEEPRDGLPMAQYSVHRRHPRQYHLSTWARARWAAPGSSLTEMTCPVARTCAHHHAVPACGTRRSNAMPRSASSTGAHRDRRQDRAAARMLAPDSTNAPWDGAGHDQPLALMRDNWPRRPSTAQPHLESAHDARRRRSNGTTLLRTPRFAARPASTGSLHRAHGYLPC